MRKIYRSIIYFNFVFISSFAYSQSGTGAWTVLSLKLNINPHWSLFNEFQVRSQRFYDDFSYYEVKGGVAYAFKKRFSSLLGFGRFVSYSNGDNFKKPYVNQEWRLWEQFLVNYYAGRVKFENRIRVEQRWTTSLGYRNRIKCRMQLVVPINHRDIHPGTIYVNGWDEVFLTNTDPHFEANRLFAGAGYGLSEHVAIQTGYLYQTNYRPDDTRSGKHYVQVTFLIEANVHRQHHETEKANGVAD